MVCYGQERDEHDRRMIDFADGRWFYLQGAGDIHVLLIPRLRQSNNFYRVLTAKTGWEWLDDVRGELRYLALVEAARELYPPNEE